MAHGQVLAGISSKFRQLPVRGKRHTGRTMNTALYLTTVLIWGTTWIAIKFQLGVVAAPVSIAYRFWIAALVLMLILLLRRQQILPPRSAWR